MILRKNLQRRITAKASTSSYQQIIKITALLIADCKYVVQFHTTRIPDTTINATIM
jgi:hypothetical protein